MNMAIAAVRRVLNLASSKWMDRQGKTWLETAPKIKLFPVRDARPPYPLSREEQALLFQELPDHLARMALFKVNTGLREQEVCGLKWDYEVKVPELETSVLFVERMSCEPTRPPSDAPVQTPHWVRSYGLEFPLQIVYKRVETTEPYLQ